MIAHYQRLLRVIAMKIKSGVNEVKGSREREDRTMSKQSGSFLNTLRVLQQVIIIARLISAETWKVTLLSYVCHWKPTRSHEQATNPYKDWHPKIARSLNDAPEHL